MKNFIKITALVAAAVFAAVSCQPVVELSDYDWGAVNAGRDAELSPQTASDFAPTASITKTTYTKDKATEISGFEIDIDFPSRADVLRGDINAASDIGFISFHQFTSATKAYEADTLGDAIPFTVENRKGKTVEVKLAKIIDVSDMSKVSNLVMRVNAKDYTYDHGLRLDIDSNGRIEDVYDDFYYQDISIGGTANYNFTGAGTHMGVSIDLANSVNIQAAAKADDVPKDVAYNNFYWVDEATASTSSAVVVFSTYVYNEPSAEEAAFAKDVGDTLAKGIKLQKLNGTSWTDVGGAAVYEGITDNEGKAAKTGLARIVVKGVTFDHLGTYRFIWNGSEFTETSGTYYGVKQRLYVNGGNNSPDNRKYLLTEVAGAYFNTANGKLLNGVDFGNIVDVSVHSYDHYYKNIVLKLDLGASYYWQELGLDAFKAGFKIVSPAGGGTASNNSTDLAFIDIVAIKYATEANDNPNIKQSNVLYVTLDPNFKYDLGAMIAYNNQHDAWEDDFADFTAKSTAAWGLCAKDWWGQDGFYFDGNGDGQWDTDESDWWQTDDDSPWVIYSALADAYETAGGTLGSGNDATDGEGNTLKDPANGMFDWGGVNVPMTWNGWNNFWWWTQALQDKYGNAPWEYVDKLWANPATKLQFMQQADWYGPVDGPVEPQPPAGSNPVFFKVNTDIGVSVNDAGTAKDKKVFGVLQDNFYGKFAYYSAF